MTRIDAQALTRNSLETSLDLEAWTDETLASTFSRSLGFKTDFRVDYASSYLAKEGLSMSITEQGS